MTLASDAVLCQGSDAYSLTQLGQQFIMPGLLDKKYGRFFSRMIQLRQKADYNSIAEVAQSEILEMAPMSKEFIAQVENLISMA